MGKSKHQRQRWIQKMEESDIDYDDEHYERFHSFLFEELLVHIKKFPFQSIIDNDLRYRNSKHSTSQALALSWLYTADRKTINEKTIYSFRFPNMCHPDFYRTFEARAHYLFIQIREPRHRHKEWYKYTGRELLKGIDNYLGIGRVVHSQIPHKTRLFINQQEERLDIQVDWYSINERLSITFEPGYPSNDPSVSM